MRILTSNHKRARAVSPAGFTLLEMLAAMAILSMLMVLLFASFNQASRAWHQGENRVETFVQGRAALDFMAKELAQAIVRSNITFFGTSTNVAFVAPVNTVTNEVDLVEIGYYLSGSSGTTVNELFRGSSTSGNAAWNIYSANWQNTLASPTNSLAYNVIFLQFVYLDNAGTAVSSWNSNVAPAGVQITLGVIDSRAVARTNAFTTVTNQSMQTFTTFVALPRR